jgi:hypothetical protein
MGSQERGPCPIGAAIATPSGSRQTQQCLSKEVNSLPQSEKIWRLRAGHAGKNLSVELRIIAP